MTPLVEATVSFWASELTPEGHVEVGQSGGGGVDSRQSARKWRG